MTKRDLVIDLLERRDRSDEEHLEALNQLVEQSGSAPMDLLRRVLVEVEEGGARFAFGEPLRMRALELLPRGDLEALDLVVEHLSLVPFVSQPEEEMEHYFVRVDEAVEVLARPYAYLDPRELAATIAERVLGREPSFEEDLEKASACRILRICDLIMGGGYCPTVEGPRTLDEVVGQLELAI